MTTAAPQTDAMPAAIEPPEGMVFVVHCSVGGVHCTARFGALGPAQDFAGSQGGYIMREQA